MAKKKRQPSSLSKSSVSSDLPQNQINLPDESIKIHQKLGKAVKLFSYWASNIESYINNDQQLHKLEQELINKQELIEEILLRPQTKTSTQQQTTASLANELNAIIKGNKKSIVIKRFLEKFKDQNKLANLTLDNFNQITKEEVNDIFGIIKPELVNPQSKTKDNVTEETFKKHIKNIISAIKDYQSTLKNNDSIKQEIEATKQKIAEIQSELKKAENLTLNTTSKNDDSTNLVAAEIGFSVEVQDTDNKQYTKYYHYPVTLSNKNTFSIYNLQNEEFNYVFTEKTKLLRGNHIVDHNIVKNIIKNGRDKADPSNDYHSENALFFLLQQRYFQEKIISKLKKDLQAKDIKLIAFTKLILEIHSTNDICERQGKCIKFSR